MSHDLLRNLQAQVETCAQERASLPAQYDQLKEQHDKVVQELEDETAKKVHAAKEELESLRRKVQSRADFLAGKVDALQHLVGQIKMGQMYAAPVAAAPPARTPMNAPEASGSEVYADPGDEDDESGDTEALEWGGGFAHEVAEASEWPEEFDTEDGTDDGTADEGDDESDDGEEDDEVADAIENASDAAAVRALLNRYIRKA